MKKWLIGGAIVALAALALWQTGNQRGLFKAGQADGDASSGSGDSAQIYMNIQSETKTVEKNGLPKNPNKDLVFDESKLRTIYLAGGCFWGLEAYMARVYGVADAVSGYANGKTENPTYEDLIYKDSGHAETVMVKYDPERVSLNRLLGYYFQVIDPTSVNKQGNDQGEQYRTGIYYTDSADLPVVEAVMARIAEKYKKPLAVEVEPLVHFYLAEEYHQDYLEKKS